MKQIITLFVGVFMLIAGSATASYHVDELEVDQLFADAQEITYASLEEMTNPDLGAVMTIVGPQADDDTHIWAALAGTLQLITGLWFIPAHRVILGTSTGTIIGYVITCGGCGLVTLVDVIVLLAKGNSGKYYDNSRFFMW